VFTNKTHRPLSYLLTGVILVLAVIGAKSVFLSQTTKLEKSVLSSEDINTPTVTATNTPTVIPAIAITNTPMPQPTTNPYLLNRVKEIDERIAELEQMKVKSKEAYEWSKQKLEEGMNDRPRGYDPMNTINAMVFVKMSYENDLKTYQEEIDRLNAEKTQIMLQM
jgi:uncharacterized small protein (DUF1192 family)